MTFQLEINSTFQDVDKATQQVLDFFEASAAEYIAGRSFYLVLSLRELLNNAVEHGNGMDPARKVHCEITCAKGIIVIEVRDEGRGFDYDAVMAEIVTADIARARQRGLLLLRELGWDIGVNRNRLRAQLQVGKEDLGL